MWIYHMYSFCISYVYTYMYIVMVYTVHKYIHIILCTIVGYCVADQRYLVAPQWAGHGSLTGHRTLCAVTQRYQEGKPWGNTMGFSPDLNLSGQSQNGVSMANRERYIYIYTYIYYIYIYN